MAKRGNPAMVKGAPSVNPHGRPPGPTAPTLLLKDAFLMAARRAGGDGPEGIANYLQGVATTHPGVFVTALSRIIPLEIDTKGSGHITIEIIQRFDDPDPPKVIEHKTNGHTNGHAIKDDDTAAE
jgi:hypothetical protein